jgi:hypothetical protein
VNVIAFIFFYYLFTVLLSESEAPTTTPVLKDVPTDIYIADRLDRPRRKILTELRLDDYNPLGYRLYTDKYERDEFGNETIVKEYRK